MAMFKPNFINESNHINKRKYYDTIIFDFGDVLDKRDKEFMYTYYEENIDPEKLSIDEFKSIIKGYPKFMFNKYGSFKTGKNINEQYRRSLDKKLAPYLDDALECMNGMATLYDYTIPMLKSLKEKGYTLYYLTNKSKWNWERHGAKDRMEPMMQYFTDGIVSCDVGVEKPDIRIYEMLIEKTGLNPNTSLFFDDKKANVDAAKKVGIDGVVFTQSIVKEIMNLPEINTESYIEESIKLPGKLYHGSIELYDELRPTGIDFGNAFQEPGWSLFTWTNYDAAIGWAIFCLIRKLNIDNKGCKNSQTTVLSKSSYEYLKNNIDNIPKKDRIFYVYTIKPEIDYKFGLGHSSNTPNCITIRRDHIKPIKIDTLILDMDYIDKYCVVVDDDYEPTVKDYGKDGRLLSFLMNHDFMYQNKLRKQIKNDIKSGKLQVGDDIVSYMKNNDIELKTVSILDRLKESYIEESKDKSSYSSLYKKKSGVSFKYIDANSPEGKKYLKDDPRWDEESIKWINTKKTGGELVVDTKNKTIAGFIFVNKSGVISPLFINRDYRGYGLSNKLVEDAINKYGGRELGVYSDNEIALNIYKRNGFKQYGTKKYKNGDEVLLMKLESFVENMRDATPEEQKNAMDSIKSISTETGVTFYDEDYIEEVSREDISSKFLEKNDTCVNLENWQPNGYNILYITGLSGSGKTTLAEDLAKEFKCYRIEQDYIGVYFFRKKIEAGTRDKVLNKLAKEAPPDAIRWLKDNKDKYCVDSWKEATPIIKEFTEWFEATHEGDGNLYIINGAWIFEYNPTHFYDRPIIIKESNTFKSLIRRTGRESGHEDSLEKNIKSFIKNISFISKKSYRDAGKRARSFAKDIASNGIEESSSYNYFITNDNGNEHFNVAKYFQMIMFQELDAYMVGNHIHPRDIESDNGCYTIATYTVDNEFNRDHIFNFLNHVSNMINNSVTSKYEIRDMSNGILGVGIKPGHENETIEDIDNKVCSNFGWTNNDLTIENIEETTVLETSTGAKVPKNVRIYRGSTEFGLSKIEPKRNKFNRIEVEASLTFKDAFIDCLDTPSTNIDTKTYKDKVQIYIDKKDFDLATPCVIYLLENDGNWFYKSGKNFNVYRRDSAAKIIDSYEFDSAVDAMNIIGGIELYDYKTRLPLNKLLEDADDPLIADTKDNYAIIQTDNYSDLYSVPFQMKLKYGMTDEVFEKAREAQERNPELVIFTCKTMTRDEFDALFNKFKGLSEKQRKICNRLSLSIYGYNMYDMYNRISVVIDKISNTKEHEIETKVEPDLVPSFNVNETLQNYMDYIKQEATSPSRDKARVAEMLMDLHTCDDYTFTESVLVKRFVLDTISLLEDKRIDSTIDLCPYFTPEKMQSMGVYNSNENDNYYKTKSDMSSLDWYKSYCECKEIVDKESWYLTLTERYNDLLKNPTDYNRQRVLELGWNPELYPSIKTIREASEYTKQSLIESTTLNNIDLTKVDWSKYSINEATSNLLPVFIVTSYTETTFGKFIRKWTNGRYSHAAITFDTTLKELYSFNVGSNTNSLGGGLSFESLDSYIQDCKDALIKVQAIFIKPEEMRIIKSKLDEYIANYKKSHYGTGNLLNVAFNRARKTNDLSMICSEFVARLLSYANIDLANGKSTNIITPVDLSNTLHKNVYLVYEGLAELYDAKATERLVNKLQRTAHYINESSVYGDKISKKLMSYINRDISPLLEARLDIDDNGDLTITDFKKIDFDSEYHHSMKLLKVYNTNENYEGMKYELAKLWYLNSLLEDKLYNNKNIFKKDLSNYNKMRSKILNLFNTNLKLVTKQEPDFDFQSYYQTTKFYDNRITVTKSTMNGIVDITKRFLK